MMYINIHWFQNNIGLGPNTMLTVSPHKFKRALAYHLSISRIRKLFENKQKTTCRPMLLYYGFEEALFLLVQMCWSRHSSLHQALAQRLGLDVVNHLSSWHGALQNKTELKNCQFTHFFLFFLLAAIFDVILNNWKLTNKCDIALVIVLIQIRYHY